MAYRSLITNHRLLITIHKNELFLNRLTQISLSLLLFKPQKIIVNQIFKMMKKFYILCLIGMFTIAISAQERIAVKSEFLKKAKVWEDKQVRDVVSPIVQNNAAPRAPEPRIFKNSRFTELDVMQTKYDLQSNKAIANRLWAWPDGTLAAVETMGNLDPGFNDRGTGYNYFDGSQWGPMPNARLETEWAGWPSLAPWGETGEINVAHLNEGMGISRRPVKGEGEWEHFTHTGPAVVPWLSWARAVASGDNNEYFHYFVNTYDPYEGQPQAMLYCRSSDGGETLDIDHELLDDISINYYSEVGGDTYAMDSRGSNIVIVFGEPWMDLIMLKSIDNGENWEKTVIWEHPYTFWDWNTTIMNTQDTLYAPDGTVSVVLDSQGMAHVAFALTRVAHWEAGTTYSLFPYVDGIGYWNENMDPIEEADDPHNTMSPDYLDEMGLLIGWSQDVNGNGQLDLDDLDLMVYPSTGLSTMPTLSIDNNDVIMLAYSSTTEGYDNTINYYKHIWTRYSPDNGQSWSGFVDLDSDFIHVLDECIYPTLATHVWDAQFHLIYSIDNYPGLNQDPGGAVHDPQTNTIWHVYFDDVVGVFDMENENISNSPDMIVSPNPCTSFADLVFELKDPQSAILEVFNISGQQVSERQSLNLTAGSNKLKVDVSTFETGVYFAVVKLPGETLTGKIVVE